MKERGEEVDWTVLGWPLGPSEGHQMGTTCDGTGTGGEDKCRVNTHRQTHQSPRVMMI